LAVLRPRKGGLRRGEIFWLRVTTASAQCLRLTERFFHSFLRSSWLRTKLSANPGHAVTTISFHSRFVGGRCLVQTVPREYSRLRELVTTTTVLLTSFSPPSAIDRTPGRAALLGRSVLSVCRPDGRRWPRARSDSCTRRRTGTRSPGQTPGGGGGVCPGERVSLVMYAITAVDGRTYRTSSIYSATTGRPTGRPRSPLCVYTCTGGYFITAAFAPTYRRSTVQTTVIVSTAWLLIST